MNRYISKHVTVATVRYHVTVPQVAKWTWPFPYHIWKVHEYKL